VQWLDGGGGYLAVRIPSPCEKADGDLKLRLHANELTLSFASPWHQHFGMDVDGMCFAADFVEFCRILDLLFDEHLVAVNFARGERWAASLTAYTTPSGDLTQESRASVLDVAARVSATRYEIRSWLGRLDREETINGNS
jgi:hypothetical protein